MIEIGKVITLSNNKKYIVVSTTEHNGQIYYSLINLDDVKDIEICFLTIENEKIRVNIVNKETEEEIDIIIDKLVAQATEKLIEEYGNPEGSEEAK